MKPGVGTISRWPLPESIKPVSSHRLGACLNRSAGRIETVCGGSSLMPKFLLQFEGAVIKEIPAKDEISVGRKADNDVVIDNPAVSGHHCKIVRSGDGFF